MGAKLAEVKETTDKALTTPKIPPSLNLPENTGYVPVFNTLLGKPGYFDSGATSYGSIREAVQDGAENGIKSFLFEFDSLGGEVMGFFEIVSVLKELKDTYDLTYTGVITGYACSACYGIASVMDKLYATQDSNVGSVAAIITHVSYVDRDAKEGIKYTFLRSKPQKAKGSPHEKLDKKTVKRWQKELTRIDEKFNNMVIANREDVTLEALEAFEGISMSADEALKHKLVDEVLPYLDTNLIDFPQTTEKPMKLEDLSPELKQQVIEEAEAKAKAKADKEAKAKAKTDDDAKKSDSHDDDLAEKIRADNVKIVKLADTLGLPSAMATDAITQGLTFKQAKAGFEFAYKQANGQDVIYQTDGSVKAPKELGTDADDLPNLEEI